MEKLRTNMPFGLVLIVAFYMFGAVILLIMLFANPTQTSSAIAKVHGLPASTGSWILPLIAGLGLLIAYGLFSLSRWGYMLAMLYLAYFAATSGWMLSRHTSAVYLGDLIWALSVIIYLILVRRRFRMR
jgi:uncharacterized membrane protein (DUF2068 family)